MRSDRTSVWTALIFFSTCNCVNFLIHNVVLAINLDLSGLKYQNEKLTFKKCSFIKKYMAWLFFDEVQIHNASLKNKYDLCSINKDMQHSGILGL